MRQQLVSHSIYQPASSFAVADRAVASYQAASRQRCAIDATDVPDLQLLAHEMRDEVDDSLAHLRDKEKDILQRYCGMSGPPESYTEIGKRYGITKQRVCEINKLSRNKVRATIIAKEDKHET